MALSSHKYPPWRRVILVPFWTLQLLLMIIIVGLLATATAILNKQYDPNADYGFANDAEVDAAVRDLRKIYAPIWIGLSALCMILTILEIIFLTRRKLTPLNFLIVNIVKSTIWSGLFIVDMIGWARTSNRRQGLIAIVIEFGIVLSFWIPLLYGSIVFHKARKEKSSYKQVSTPLPADDTSYPSQFPSTQLHRDDGGHDYRGQVSGTTGNAPPYDPYKPGQSYGDVGLAHNSPHIMSPGVPQVFVQHHEEQHNVYELGARRNMY